MIRSERQKMPTDVANAHQLWQLGLGSMRPYIKWHADLALRELARLVNEYNLERHGEPKLESDGWMDGMRVLTAVVETPKGKLLKLQWQDSNQGFFKRLSGGGGSGALFAKDLTD